MLSAPRKSIVHIGFHKTGSTSIQHFLAANRPVLEQNGYWFYSGKHEDLNHLELHAATMRAERTSTFKNKSSINFDEQYLSDTKASLDNFFDQFESGTAIFSAEGLSLLRYADEAKRLAWLLQSDVRIVVYLRNLEDYRRSHTKQLKSAGYTNVKDKDSHAYMQEDSWMFDYELRLRPYRETFGSQNVHVIDYDVVKNRDGSVIPSFIDFLNLSEKFSEDDWQDIWLNQS